MNQKFNWEEIKDNKFNKLMPLSYLGFDGTHHYIEFLCDCGKLTKGTWNEVKGNKKKGCGCQRGLDKRIDLIGQTFGNLKVLERALSRKVGTKTRGYFLCLCVCGKETEVETNCLTSGNTTSCGCRKGGFKENPLKTHPKYVTWSHIRERCYSKTCKLYSYYGELGVIMEEPWFSDPRSFLDWYDANCNGNYKLVVDRKEQSGNYSPQNCRLVTQKENSNNKKNNRIVELFGEKLTFSQALDKYATASGSAIQERIANGWKIEDAFTTPPRGKVLLSKTPKQRLQESLNRLRQRCHNPNNKDYPNYGAKGITVCEEWLINPESYYTWALENGWAMGLDIDRIDNNFGYSADNCKWSTTKENANNMTTNIIVELEGESMTFSQAWDKYKGCPIDTAYSRYRAGWDIELAIKTPPRH